MKVLKIPTDVRTRWNSTYDLLAFPNKYSKAFDLLTADCGLKLHCFEMNEEEWELAGQLERILEVSTAAIAFNSPPLTSLLH